MGPGLLFIAYIEALVLLLVVAHIGALILLFIAYIGALGLVDARNE